MFWYSIECLRLLNRFDSLKHAQHFNAHDSNQKKKRKKSKIYSVYIFSEHLQHYKTFWKLTNSFELIANTI